jgi:ATP-dependent Clp protease ATP-binding subunit ClpC
MSGNATNQDFSKNAVRITWLHVILPPLFQRIPAMLERCAQNARRVIFLASKEAIRYGSPYIESEHLLLGILRENEALATRIGGEMGSIQLFRNEIEAGMFISQQNESGEAPLGPNSRRILDFAAEEAGALGQSQITLGHYLLGILRVEECIASKVLQAHGITITAMREQIIQDARWAG